MYVRYFSAFESQLSHEWLKRQGIHAVWRERCRSNDWKVLLERGLPPLSSVSCSAELALQGRMAQWWPHAASSGQAYSKLTEVHKSSDYFPLSVRNALLREKGGAEIAACLEDLDNTQQADQDAQIWWKSDENCICIQKSDEILCKNVIENLMKFCCMDLMKICPNSDSILMQICDDILWKFSLVQSAACSWSCGKAAQN